MNFVGSVYMRVFFTPISINIFVLLTISNHEVFLNTKLN